MKPSEFQYHAPTTVDEAAQLLGTLEDALSWAKEISALAPLTLSYYKQALNHVGGSDLADPELLAAFEACWESQDLEEGRRARTEKRAPDFQGR